MNWFVDNMLVKFLWAMTFSYILSKRCNPVGNLASTLNLHYEGNLRTHLVHWIPAQISR